MNLREKRKLLADLIWRTTKSCMPEKEEKEPTKAETIAETIHVRDFGCHAGAVADLLDILVPGTKEAYNEWEEKEWEPKILCCVVPLDDNNSHEMPLDHPCVTILKDNDGSFKALGKHGYFPDTFLPDVSDGDLRLGTEKEVTTLVNSFNATVIDTWFGAYLELM